MPPPPPTEADETPREEADEERGLGAEETLGAERERFSSAESFGKTESCGKTNSLGKTTSSKGGASGGKGKGRHDRGPEVYCSRYVEQL